MSGSAGGELPTPEGTRPRLPFIDDMAEWLCAINYGADYAYPKHPLPEFLRLPFAEAWWRREGCNDTVEDYMWMLQQEGAW